VRKGKDRVDAWKSNFATPEGYTGKEVTREKASLDWKVVAIIKGKTTRNFNYYLDGVGEK